jgi:hypothetical protein
MLRISLFVSLAMLAPAVPLVGAETLGSDLDLGEIRLKAPEGWSRKAPRSRILMAEFSLPRAEGDERDGRLTISRAGGGLKANIDRWRQQFSGSLGKDSQKTEEISGVDVTLVDFSGTYMDRPGPFAPGVEREGYRMMAAIIPAGGQPFFIKAYGPDKTMARHAKAFNAFLKTLEVK